MESVLANHVSLVNVYQSLVLFALRFFLNLSLIHFCEGVLLIFPTYEIGRFSRLDANPHKWSDVRSVGKVYQGTFSGSDEIGENLHSPPNREEGEKDCCLCIRYIPIWDSIFLEVLDELNLWHNQRWKVGKIISSSNLIQTLLALNLQTGGSDMVVLHTRDPTFHA